MFERRCDCAACRARRLAMWMLLAAIAIVLGVGIHMDRHEASSAPTTNGGGW